MREKEDGIGARRYRTAQWGIASVLSLCLIFVYMYRHIVLSSGAQLCLPGAFLASWNTYDPEMPYFLSSLGIFKGESYVYVDHPGTPIQIVGSLILGVMRMIHGGTKQAFVVWQVAHPSLFFAVAHALLTIGSVAGVFLLSVLAIRAKRWADVAMTAAVAMAFYALHPASFFTLIYWSHNSACFIGGTSLLLFFVRLADRSSVSMRHFVLPGLLSGILASVQLYFVAWMVGLGVLGWTLSSDAGRRIRMRTATVLLVVCTSLGGYVLATLPVLSEYPRIIRWFSSLALHEGRYGGGAATFTSFGTLWDNALALVQDLPVLCAAVLLVTALLVWQLRLRRRLNVAGGPCALAPALLVQLVLLCAAIIKHPGVAYALAPAAVLPIALVVVYRVIQSQRFKTLFACACALCFGLLFVLNLRGVVSTHRAAVEYTRNVESMVQRRRAACGEARDCVPEDVMVLWTYGTASEPYSLWFGNDYTGHVFSQEIGTIWPSDRGLNIWNRGIMTEEGRWTTSDGLQWDLLVARREIVREYPFILQLGTRDEEEGDYVFVYPLPQRVCRPEN